MQKRRFIPILLFLLVSGVCSARYVVIHHRDADRSNTELLLTADTRLTFDSGDLCHNPSDTRLPLAGISKITFAETSGVEDITAVTAPSLHYDGASAILSVDGAASAVQIFNLSGSLCMSAVSAQTVDLSTLPRGVYIARADGSTLKFVR